MEEALIHLPPILGAIIFGGLQVVVALSKPRTRLQQIFQVYLLAMFIWSVSAFMTLSGLVVVLPWFRIMTIAPIIMTVAFFYFVQTLFGIRRKWISLAILYSILIIPLSLFTPLLIKSAHLESSRLFYEFGPLVFFIAVPGYGLNFLSLGDLARGYKQTRDINQKNRFRYLILGLSITILATLINFTEWGKYPIDIAANTLTAALIAYAILRHQLLDIQIVVRLGLLYSITTGILGLIYFLAISLTLQLVEAFSGSRIFLLSFVVALLTAAVISPLRDAAQTWVDRLFYREKYNASLMLQRLSRTTAALMDLEKIAKIVLSDVVETLHIGRAAIFIKSDPEGNFRLLAEQGAQKTPPPKFDLSHPIVRWLVRRNRILSKNDLAIRPIFRAMWSEELKYLNEFPAELFIPLATKGELAGFLMVGPKLSGQSYSFDDEVSLTTLANQTAIVIENARLYEDLENTFVQTVVTLANAIDMRDTYTSSHSQRIAAWAADIARVLGCTPQEIQDVYWAGLLHDIGKIGIPDAILNKPTHLVESEWEIIRKHTIVGARLISSIKKLADVAPIVECSHERLDGSGYPHGLKGEEIPLGARIIGVVDSYSAMRDERTYKKSIGHNEAVEELKRNAGILFDTQVVSVFLYLLNAGTK